MKKLLLIPILICAFLLTACHTVSTYSVDSSGKTNVVTQTVPDAATVQIVATTAKSAAYLGTKIYLEGLPPRVPGHPEARAQFELARTSLKGLLALGTFSTGDLSAVLSQLPIKELQGENGTLIVGEAVVLWDTYGRQLANLDKAKVFDGYIKPVAQSILDGLNMALGKPQAMSKPAFFIQPKYGYSTLEMTPDLTGLYKAPQAFTAEIKPGTIYGVSYP